MAKYRGRRRLRVVDEFADVTPEQWAYVAASAGMGLIGFAQREAIEAERPPRAHTFDRAEYLEKLRRDFGPETARLAELWEPQEREARERAVQRQARKLDAAGRYGFR